MNQEIETRAIINEDKYEETIAFLSLLGFVQVEDYEQVDIIIDDKDASLFKSEQKIRIRIENGKCELTYKGRFEGNSEFISKRKELNIPIENSSVNDLISLFNCIGYPILFQISKRRRVFHFQGVHINIDKWPIIGYLLELEGDKKIISKIILKLKSKLILKNFRLKELFENKCKETGKTFKQLKDEYEQKNNISLGNIEYIF